jgi:predicted nuclease of predicted toxin-antitoxin system
VRFLLDQNLSPVVADLLCGAGHDAIHARTLGLSRANDERILAVAAEQQRVLVSADTDLGELLAISNASRPSVLLVRRQQGRRAAELAPEVLCSQITPDPFALARALPDAGWTRAGHAILSYPKPGCSV